MNSEVKMCVNHPDRPAIVTLQKGGNKEDTIDVCGECQKMIVAQSIVNWDLSPDSKMDIVKFAIELHCMSHLDIARLIIAVKLSNANIATNTAKNATKFAVSELLDSEEFYNAMQYYRNAPMTDQELVVGSFEAVKEVIKKVL